MISQKVSLQVPEPMCSNSLLDKANHHRKILKFKERSLVVLRSVFNENPFPKKQKTDELATSLGETYQRVKEWFRCQRKRILHPRISKKKKHEFSEKAAHFLFDVFKKNQYPTHSELEDMAKALNCKINNLLNWFEYRRKLLRKQPEKTPSCSASLSCSTQTPQTQTPLTHMEIPEEQKKETSINMDNNRQPQSFFAYNYSNPGMTISFGSLVLLVGNGYQIPQINQNPFGGFIKMYRI